MRSNPILASLLLSFTVAVAPVAQAIESLHSAMPDDAVAYLRLAGPHTFVGPATDTPIHHALTQGDLQQRSVHLVDHLATELAAQPEFAEAAPWLDLLARLRAPIEAVALLPVGRPVSMANVLLRAGIDVADARGADQLIGQWTESNPDLDMIEPSQTNGVGRLTWQGSVPLLYHFDASDAVIYVMAGLAADVPSLESALSGLQARPSHPMHALEARLDETASGPFLWLDGTRVMSGLAQGPMAGAGEADGMAGMLPGMAAGAVGQLGVGWGARAGKGRLGLVMEMPPGGGMGAMLPTIDNHFDVSAVGEPWLLATMTIPALQMLQTFEGLLQMDPEAYADYVIDKAAFKQNFGYSYEDLAGILGPEILAFGDDVGEYGAVRVADKAAWEQLLQSLAASDGVRYEQHDSGGVVYHHLAVSSAPAELDGADDAADDGVAIMNAIERIQAKADTHFYWVVEGDYLIFSQVPQALMDRAAASNEQRLSIDGWLRQRQGQDPDRALLLVASRLEGVPRRVYYSTLSFLQQVGDITGQPMDLYGYQSATALQLPRTGAFGFQIDQAADAIMMEFSFETNPVELLLSRNGAFMAGVIGAALGAAADDDDADDAEGGCAAADPADSSQYAE